MPFDNTTTTDQFEAFLREAARGVKPEQLKPASIAQLLEPHKKTLLKFRSEGYSLQQLALFLKQSKLEIDTTPTFLRNFLARSRTTKTKAGVAQAERPVKFVALTRPRPPVAAPKSPA